MSEIKESLFDPIKEYMYLSDEAFKRTTLRLLQAILFELQKPKTVYVAHGR